MYRRSENGVANCDHSSTCSPNLVNFGPPTAKNSAAVRSIKLAAITLGFATVPRILVFSSVVVLVLVLVLV